MFIAIITIITTITIIIISMAFLLAPWLVGC